MWKECPIFKYKWKYRGTSWGWAVQSSGLSQLVQLGQSTWAPVCIYNLARPTFPHCMWVWGRGVCGSKKKSAHFPRHFGQFRTTLIFWFLSCFWQIFLPIWNKFDCPFLNNFENDFLPIISPFHPIRNNFDFFISDHWIIGE